MADPNVIGGAFFRKFDGRHPRLMWLESVARFLTRHGGTLYGDQSIFVRRDVFMELGGFAKIPLMEDVEFSRRLRGAGKIAVLDPPVQSSARRHLRKGAWRTSIQNGLFIVLYNLGVSPHTAPSLVFSGARSSPETGFPEARSLTAGSLARQSTVGGHRPPLQIHSTSSDPVAELIRRTPPRSSPP